MKKGQTVLIRSGQSGVHVGTLQSISGASRDSVTLTKSRRIWSWSGANECCDIAQHGIDPANSRVSTRVPRIMVNGVCEIIPMTKAAAAIISSCPEWVANKA